MGKVVIDNIDITPNPVYAGAAVVIEIELHEENAGAKRYAYKYPARYAGKKEEYFNEETVIQ